MKHSISYEKYMFNQMKQIIATYFVLNLQYFNQFLKFLQRFAVFDILKYHGPYLWSYGFVRLNAIVCCFYVFPPELGSARTEIIVWLLKVKYLLLYFR